MYHQRSTRSGIHRQHDEWDEVHNQMLEVQQQKVQKKSLELSNPGDADEQEADEVARKVVDGQSAEIHETGETINRKGDSPAEATPEFQSKLENKKGTGQSLPENVQQEMGSRMGADFSHVKIHDGSDANEMSESIHAKAFTHGQDVFFKQGQFNPGSKEGKELLAHELVHTVQQGNTLARKIQRTFTPEDASEEMVGKKFTLDREIKIFSHLAGYVTFPVGQVVTIKTWSNDNNKVTVNAYNKEKKKSFELFCQKHWLTPAGDQASGLYQYSAGVSDTKKDLAAGEQKIENWKKKEAEYKKAGTMNIYNAELDRLQDLQDKRFGTLNSRMIQETMYNAFDVDIVKWVNYYHTEIGVKKGWTKVDANLVKSMMFQETSMGTTGDHLPVVNPTLGYATKTSYNLMQAIDSSGMQQILMMRDYDAKVKPPKKTLQSQYDYEKSLTDYYAAKAVVKKKEVEKKKLDAAEQKIYDDAIRVIKGPDGNYYWNEYFRNHPNWKSAVTAFFSMTSPGRNLTYDFWIQVGVRWLYEKRKDVSTWEEAARAFNGSGTGAEGYKKNVTERMKRAKTADSAGKSFIPQKDY